MISEGPSLQVLSFFLVASFRLLAGSHTSADDARELELNITSHFRFWVLPEAGVMTV